MKRYLYIILALTLSSCVKEFSGPIELPVAGKWVSLDKEGFAAGYVELKGGQFNTYNLSSSCFYSEKSLYGVSMKNTNPISSTPYTIRDGVWYCDGMTSKISFSDNMMVLADKKYYPLEKLNGDYYTSITGDTYNDGNRVVLDYSKQNLSWTYDLKTLKGEHPFGNKVDVAVMANWIEVVQITEKEVVFELAENNSGASRSSKVVVSYPSAESIEIKIEQGYSIPQLNLSSKSAVTDYLGGKYEFTYDIANPRDGKVVSFSCNQSWIKDIAHVGNSIACVVSENNTGYSRQGTINLTYGDIKASYSITQTGEAPEVVIGQTSTAAGYREANYEFAYVLANPRENFTLNVKCEEDWVTGLVAEDNTVSFTALENNTGDARNANIVLTYGSSSVTHVVTQDSGNIRVHLAQSTLSCGYAKGDYSFKYTVDNAREGMKASVSCQSDWIEQLTVFGDEVSFSVKENNSGASRSADVVLTFGSVSATYKVTQSYSAPKVTLSSSTKSCGYAAADYSFTYSIANPREGQAVQVSTSATWITDLVNVGNNVSYSVQENTASSSRTGNIVVSYGSVSATYKVTQSYSTAGISLPTSSVTLSEVSDTYEFDYTISNAHANMSVEVSCNVPWITEIVVADGKVKYTVMSNDGTSVRTGKITLTYGGKSVVYTISQIMVLNLVTTETANCYIVSSAGKYRFPAVKGNSTTSVGTVSKVEVLWESYGTSTTPAVGNLIKSVAYGNNYITFTTADTFTKGNAVIAAKNSSGTILWSWHIWLTDQPQEQVYYNNAGTMMDRNLGATAATKGSVASLGLLYQWGRKDPFLGSSSISSSTIAKSTITWPSAVASTSSNGTIAYATKNPTTFIKYNSNNYDWCYSSSSTVDNTRWQSTKTIYDPCPPGWRVPDGSGTGVWATAVGNTSFTKSYNSSYKGTEFTGYFGSASSIWYPMAGYIWDGTMSTAGSCGYYWSCNATDYGIGYCLYTLSSSTTVNNSYSQTLSAAASVRCQKKEMAADIPGNAVTKSYHIEYDSTYGWQKSTTVNNPDSSTYDGVYQSDNKGVDSSTAYLYIDISGYTNFKVYIRSYAEGSYDYVIAYALDSTSSEKVTTKGNQNSSTSIGGYTLVEYTNIDGGNHRITIAYKKDSSRSYDDDRGYVLIPKNQ